MLITQGYDERPSPRSDSAEGRGERDFSRCVRRVDRIPSSASPRPSRTFLLRPWRGEAELCRLRSRSWARGGRPFRRRCRLLRRRRSRAAAALPRRLDWIASITAVGPGSMMRTPRPRDDTSWRAQRRGVPWSTRASSPSVALESDRVAARAVAAQAPGCIRPEGASLRATRRSSRDRLAFVERKSRSCLRQIQPSRLAKTPTR